MQLIIRPDGTLRTLYSETLDLASFGRMHIERASHVEPDRLGSWYADLSPVDGPRLGPFRYRTQALAAEQRWLESHRL